MSEAENAFLHVHLYLCSWNHGHKIMRKFLGQPFGCKIWTVQEPELTEKMLRKSLFQDCWLKDIVYQEWVLKDKLDKHYAWCVACEIQLIFCVPYCVSDGPMGLTKSNIGHYKSLFGSSPSPWEPWSIIILLINLNICKVNTELFRLTVLSKLEHCDICVQYVEEIKRQKRLFFILSPFWY